MNGGLSARAVIGGATALPTGTDMLNAFTTQTEGSASRDSEGLLRQRRRD